MKIKKILLGTLLTASFMLTSCGGTSDDLPSDSDLAGTYNITLWVSEVTGVDESFRTQIRDFEALHTGITINETIEGVTEAESATQMLTDVSAGADIYCFAQDQFARLVQGGALSKLGTQATANVKADNDAGAVAAVTSGDTLYAYPLTSDNGYFLYYDKSVFTQPSDIENMTNLLATAKAAGKNVSFEMGTSAWYLASYFFGTGCHSTWSTNSKGKFTAVSDDFDSDNGVIAGKGIYELVKSTNYVSSSATADLSAATPSAALVSGTWAYNDVKTILGDNLGAAKLPKFTVDGTDYQLGSFSGNKLLGVKPHDDAKMSAVCQKLAAYLTGQKCQEERFDGFAWGPSNRVVQAMDKVKSNLALAALAEQNEYATPQGQIHGSWWDIAKVIATGIAGTDGSTTAIKGVLDAYQASLDDCLNVKPWGIVGSMAASNWSTNIDLTNNDDDTWTIDYALAVGDQFKVRQGSNWDSFGDLTLHMQDTQIIKRTDGNLECLTAGTYHFLINADGNSLEITLNA